MSLTTSSRGGNYGPPTTKTSTASDCEFPPGASPSGLPLWAMAVHRVADRFIMNHGSFTKPGVQNVIRFWESKDLVHWTFMGNQADLLPDTRWYPADSRLDCMSVVPVVEGDKTRYYGYATGPGGFLESDDGIRWSGKPAPTIDWGVFPPPPTPKDEGMLEIGGCHQIGDRFYLVGGWFNYMGHTGYGVFTLVARSPSGPFIAENGQANFENIKIAPMTLCD